mgnify:CR=1 FL=1
MLQAEQQKLTSGNQCFVQRSPLKQKRNWMSAPTINESTWRMPKWVYLKEDIRIMVCSYPWMIRLIFVLVLMLECEMWKLQSLTMLLMRLNKESCLSMTSVNQNFTLQPSSFRVIAGHHEDINGVTHLVNDIDQTLVTIRPKYFIGSSGSVWASDTILLRQELSHLFEVQDENKYQYYSIPLHRFCATIQDGIFYFSDSTMHGDVMSITISPKLPVPPVWKEAPILAWKPAESSPF